MEKKELMEMVKNHFEKSLKGDTINNFSFVDDITSENYSRTSARYVYSTTYELLDNNLIKYSIIDKNNDTYVELSFKELVEIFKQFNICVYDITFDSFIDKKYINVLYGVKEDNIIVTKYHEGESAAYIEKWFYANIGERMFYKGEWYTAGNIIPGFDVITIERKGAIEKHYKYTRR